MRVSKRAKPFTYRNQCQKHVKTILELRERITEKSRECNDLALENMALQTQVHEMAANNKRYEVIMIGFVAGEDEGGFTDDVFSELRQCDTEYLFSEYIDSMLE